LILQVSTLHPGETAILLASLESLFEKRFNCDDCLGRYGDSVRGKERSVAHRRKKGCFDYTSQVYVLDDYKYLSCIGNFQDISVRYYWELFQKYEKNILPYKGSLQEQPNKIIEIFNFIDAILKRKQENKKEGKKQLTQDELKRQIAKLNKGDKNGQ